MSAVIYFCASVNQTGQCYLSIQLAENPNKNAIS